MINGIILYSAAFALTGLSFAKNKERTSEALQKAWGMFRNVMPDVLAIMLFVGLSLSILTPSLIASIVGEESGVMGVIYSTVIGSVSLIPSFVVFPMGETLVENGAGLPQVAALMASLMAVGLVSMPLEKKMFGKGFAYARNVASFIMSILFALIIWGVMG